MLTNNADIADVTDIAQKAEKLNRQEINNIHSIQYATVRVAKTRTGNMRNQLSFTISLVLINGLNQFTSL